MIARTVKEGSEWFQKRRLGVVMLGHRNSTAFYFDQGQLKSGSSPLIGFAQMVDEVVRNTSRLDRSQITEAIFQGEYEANRAEFQPWSTSPRLKLEAREAIKNLAQAKDASLRQSEIAAVCSEISVATDEYWEKVRDWLDEAMPEKLDEVLISGGASYYLRGRLENYFNCKPREEERRGSVGREKVFFYEQKLTEGQRFGEKIREFTPIVWGSGLQEEVDSILSISWRDEREKFMKYRLVDAFSMLDYLLQA